MSELKVPAAGDNRMAWAEVPPTVRRGVEEIAGGAVTSTRDHQGGFTPGLAATCRLDTGGAVFVKAVGRERNENSVRMYRREAERLSTLPAALPRPELHGMYDDGEWVALVFENIDGPHPAQPWTWEELEPAVNQVRAMHATPLSPEVELPSFADMHEHLLDGWRRMAEHPAPRLDPWARQNLETLAAIEPGWEAAAAGTSLLHGDLRADNMLWDGDRLILVDWPLACRGAPAADLVMWLIPIGIAGPDPIAVTRRCGLFDDLPAEQLLSLVVAITGYFVDKSLQPPPPNLAAVRGFQAAQGEVGLRWARALLG